MVWAAVKLCSGMDGGSMAPSGRAWEGCALALDAEGDGVAEGLWFECKLDLVGVGVVSLMVEGSSAFKGTCRDDADQRKHCEQVGSACSRG